jgi:cytochrome c553
MMSATAGPRPRFRESSPRESRRRKEQWKAAVVTLGLLGALPRPGWAQDAEAGGKLAERWCTTCHVVSPTQARATSTGAPTFTSIAARRSFSPDTLRAFLQTSHVRMPDLHLSRQEISDLTAHIESLRPVRQ